MPDFRLASGACSASFNGAPAGAAKPLGLRASFLGRASLADAAIQRGLAPLGVHGRRQRTAPQAPSSDAGRSKKMRAEGEPALPAARSTISSPDRREGDT
jgi:hypothetical protein